ncbi:phosphotransferase [Nonomuraea sp. M3C6]|uniref:Phosphotransferase n=1 Tax=Nonomuraea marmarensis TaxID=3351344 RepID=A0ABW7AGJ6_9ACTN
MKVFTKTYAGTQVRQTAQDHYRWIAHAIPGIRIPAIVDVRSTEIDFEHLPGRHVGPGDLLPLADLLGRQHAAAYTRALHGAHLDKPHTMSGITIAAFAQGRRERLHELLASGAIPQSLLTPEAADAWFQEAADLPAAFYKDANPRNFLITGTAIAVVDFDSLTLAPFGYDLAKLIVTTAMTVGPLPGDIVRQAVDTYNRRLRDRELRRCSARQFATWTEFHHILTTPYMGTNGYRFGWHTVRPAWITEHLLRRGGKEPAP